MSTMTSPQARRGNAAGPGFVLSHLMGEYSLGRSYWVHTVLLGGVVTAVGVVLLGGIGQRYGLRYLSMGVIAFEIAVVMVWLWALAGTWMASLRHLMGQGNKLWAVLAMASLAIASVHIVREASQMRPFIAEHWATAMGRQPAEDFHIELVDGGRVVAFSGGVNESAAAALDKAIAQAPKVTTVRLESPGGWLSEGERMADVVRRYGLRTRIETECHSSCTLVFLAGNDRTMAPGARLGFHRGRAIGGEDPNDPPDRREAAIYLRAGLQPAFVQRILATPHASIWMPSHEFLYKSGVLTRRE